MNKRGSILIRDKMIKNNSLVGGTNEKNDKETYEINVVDRNNHSSDRSCICSIDY